MKPIHIVMLCLLFTGCCRTTQDTLEATKPPEITQDEYDIYSVLIEELYIGPISEIVVIGDSTSFGIVVEGESNIPMDIDEVLSRVQADLVQADQEAVTDFRIKNEQPCLLENKFNVSVEVELIGESQRKQAFSRGWATFYEYFPHSSGLVALSRIGFNNNRDQALVYTGYQREALWGRGFLISLAKIDGIWIIQEQVQIWVS